MRFVIQRVSEASVTIDNTIHSSIQAGLLILMGVEELDTTEDADWLCQKLIGLRIFSDTEHKMNLSLKDLNGDVLLVSQFTLFASTKKGNRPSFIKSAKPGIAIPLYEYCIQQLSSLLEKPIKTGVFGADMKVSLINDGPVTIIIDSKNKE
jgi:D-tyrosyl-tRNA(Tyr) deacylase